MRIPSLVLLAGLVACAGTSAKPDDTEPSPTDDTAGPGPDTGDTGDTGDPPGPDTICADLGLPVRAFDPAPPAAFQRHQPAGDFSVPLRDGTTFTLSERWTGCESYLFLPHWWPVSELDSATYWSTGVDELIEKSPRNVHYFFTVAGNRDGDAEEYGAQMDTWIGEALASLDDDERAHWEARLHVVQGPSSDAGTPIQEMFAGPIGQFGWAVDRGQKIRTLGYFPSVDAFDPALNNGGYWPWEMEIYMAAKEAEYFNWEAARQEVLDAEDASGEVLVVPVFGGDVVSQYVDGTLTLPDAATLAQYDTLHIDVRMECPDKDNFEINNCGPWDYLAYFWLDDPSSDGWLEMARFITTYHRESRWVVDASHALAWLQAGGDFPVRYEWAPSWNVQPTGVTVSLRLSNRGKGSRPVQAIPLFQGGAFGSTYNVREPLAVEIPASARKVELVAITTGHGMGTNNCAEFCDQRHFFTVAGVEHEQALLDPGDDDACAEAVGTLGVVPNQAGTWWFGRGGWCPGLEVTPFVVDVTADAAPGTTISASYRATQGTREPADGSGDIVLRSWLIISE